jgi:4-aminobutyrate--pyruvate transaminase
VTPDLMPVSKALSSGYMPIGATLISERVEQAFRDGDPRDSIFAHGQTFGAHPVACAVALENLNIMEEGDFCSRANDMGSYLRSAFSTLADLECFVDIRGLGMVNGLEVRAPLSSKLSNKEAATLLRRDMRQKGLITIPVHPGNVFLITPPIVAREADIDAMVLIIRDSLETLGQAHS